MLTFSNVAFNANSMHIAYKEWTVWALISIGCHFRNVENVFMWAVSKFRESNYRNEEENYVLLFYAT